MSGKRLTRNELDRIKRDGDLHPNISIYRLADHIEDVGVFAPEAPTDEQINAGIARGMGWVHWGETYGSLSDEPTAPRWTKDGQFHIYEADWQPATNLGQALEAAAALTRRGVGENRVIRSGAPYIHEQVNRVVFQGATSADAARAIALHLFERITNAGTEPEDERARRFT